MGEGLKRRLEGEIEIRVAGGDAFHEMFLSNPHHMSNVNPLFIQGCDLHDGAFGKPGSIICWRYTLDGKVQSCKEIIEVIDEENKVIKLKVIEADFLEKYKNFVITSQVTPKGKEISIVKWVFEYEKLQSGIPDPSTLMDTLVKFAKEIDDHHHQPK